jgi:hypothetical protein
MKLERSQSELRKETAERISTIEFCWQCERICECGRFARIDDGLELYLCADCEIGYPNVRGVCTKKAE